MVIQMDNLHLLVSASLIILGITTSLNIWLTFKHASDLSALHDRAETLEKLINDITTNHVVEEVEHDMCNTLAELRGSMNTFKGERLSKFRTPDLDNTTRMDL